MGMIFGRPDGLDPRFRLVPDRKFLNVQHHQKPTPTQMHNVTSQTAFSLALLFIVILENYLAGIQLFFFSYLISIGLINSGAIPHQRRWIFYWNMPGWWW